MTIDFIQTKENQHVLKLVQRRIRNKRSSVMLGNHGAGKSRLLNEIRKDYPNAPYLTGLGTVTQLIGEMAGETEVRPHRKYEYLRQMRRNPKIVFIDECQHMRKEVFPYLKLFIDHGNIFVMAGLPSLVEHMVDSKNADVLSRFLRININAIGLAELKATLSDFEESAIKLIHGQAESTRVIVETIEDCRDYARENGIAMITADLAEKIFNGEL